ncbi:MAG: hypothetical protein PHV06_04640 [bacterium]|nr:hypothetical protein [bacterium]
MDYSILLLSNDLSLRKDLKHYFKVVNLKLNPIYLHVDRIKHFFYRSILIIDFEKENENECLDAIFHIYPIIPKIPIVIIYENEIESKLLKNFSDIHRLCKPYEFSDLINLLYRINPGFFNSAERQLKLYLQEKPEKSIRKIIKRNEFNHRKLYYEFKKHYGCTPGKYLRELSRFTKFRKNNKNRNMHNGS